MPPSMPLLSSGGDPTHPHTTGSSHLRTGKQQHPLPQVSSIPSKPPPSSRSVTMTHQRSVPSTGNDGGGSSRRPIRPSNGNGNRRSHETPPGSFQDHPTTRGSRPRGSHPLVNRIHSTYNNSNNNSSIRATGSNWGEKSSLDGSAMDARGDDDDGTDQILSTIQERPLNGDNSGNQHGTVVGDSYGMTLNGGVGGGLAGLGGMSSMMSSSPYGYYGGGSAASMMMMAAPPLPYMMGGVGGMGGGSGPLASLYQALYGIQNVVFSITQAVQLVSMNKQLLVQAWESLSQIVDHAIATFSELRTLENAERDQETEHDKQRRERLKALRYALVFGGSWVVYKLIRNLITISKKSSRRLLQQQQQQQQYGNNPYTMDSQYPVTPYVANNQYALSSSPFSYGAGYPNGSYGMYGAGAGYSSF